MYNVKCELFSTIGNVDVICITTNGFVKNSGECVMGRGCALTAKQLYPQLPIILGMAIRHNGNHSVKIHEDKGTEFWSFPVKHNWWEEADIELIKRSAHEMVQHANNHPHWTKILIPRPGCGNGKLSYKTVEPVLQEILDNRFYIVTF